MATLLDGRKASAALLESLKDEVAELDPHLVVVQVGDDPASSSYIKQKIKSCERVKLRSSHLHLPAETSLEELLTQVEALNGDPDVSGFFVQLPLPEHLSSYVPQIIKAIDPQKDIDGFCAYNLGKVFLAPEFEHLPPATPGGIVWLLEHYQIEVAGKEVVVVGRSNTVGKPLAVMLLNRNATVTICHSKTSDVAAHTKRADIVVAAVGRPHFLTADMVKEGAVVVDVGIHRSEAGLIGDTNFAALEPKVAAITPVPGGVGPMTVASLIRNCVMAKRRQA